MHHLNSRKESSKLNTPLLCKSYFGKLAIIVLVLLSFTFQLQAKIRDTIFKTQANVVVELTFTATHSYPDPFNQVTLDAVFTDPKGRQLRVPCFWDGNDQWKVRYSSGITGTHKFKTECSEKGDKGLHGITGKVLVRANTGKNPLLKHAALRIAD